MTVEEMRAKMRRRVIPENIVVQNIVEYLMDENAQLPQLNAFSFLSRLHDLGMGSADFVTLLEGCGAPKSAVNKIKSNPAMNLQNLILTLEDSGLTSEDYSEMLYTARMVWEQTHTINEYGEINPYVMVDGAVSSEDDESEEAPEKTASEIFDDIPEENSAENPEYEQEKQPIEEGLPDEEPTFEEIMQHIHGAKSAEKASESKEFHKENDFEEKNSEEAHAENSEETHEEKTAEQDEGDEEISDEILAEEAQIDEEILIEEPKSVNLNDTSTLIISINPEQLKKDIENKSEDNEENSEENAEEDNQEAENSDDKENEEVSDARDDKEEGENEEKLSASGYNKLALILSAAGAAILVVLCAVLMILPKAGKSAKPLDFADNPANIFNEVYKSYNAEIIGGENAQKYFTGEKLFGKTLVSQSEFGFLSDGNFVYTASSEKIEPYNFDLSSEKQIEILPPQNTKFVDFIQSENYLTAVFSGSECGFMRIENGAVTFTVRQDGELCDFAVEENEILFGSVYVPHYTKSFTAVDVNEYLPRVGKNEKTAISAGNVVLGNSSGCSFAVWGKYSLSDGSIISARAALGNPVYAGAYGVCAMNFKDGENEFGRIISLSDELKVIKTDKISAAANSKNASAFLQGDVVNIYSVSLEEASVLSNLPQIPDAMKFDSVVLLLNGKDGIFSAVDCSIPKAPVPIETQKANGVVSGNSAALFNTEKMFEITFLQLENEEVKQLGVYYKTLSESELSTLELGGANMTAFCGGNCAVAYKYFDGVSVVSECVVFGNTSSENVLYDDKTGYTAVFNHKNRIIAVNSLGAQTVFE